MNAVVHTGKMVRKEKTMTAVNGAIEAAEQGALVTVVGMVDGTQACYEEAVKSFQRAVKCGGYATAYEKHMPWVLRHEMRLAMLKGVQEVCKGSDVAGTLKALGTRKRYKLTETAVKMGLEQAKARQA